MTDQQGIRDKVERTAAMYPDQRERLEALSRDVAELDEGRRPRTRLRMDVAFDRALQQIIDARSPEQARAWIDRIEHTLMGHPLFGAMRRNVYPGWLPTAVLLAVVLAAAGLIVVAQRLQ